MSPGTKSFFQRWIVTTLGVLAAATIVDGIEAESMVWLLGASLILGILNAILRPFLMLLALPLLLLTLGLFTFVINAMLLYLVGSILGDGFLVADFWSAFKGGLVISIVSIIANLMIGKEKPPVHVHTTTSVPPPSRNKTDTGTGPIIDV